MSESATPPDPEHVPSPWMKTLSEHGQIKTFPPRTIIIHEGDSGGAIYIVKEGSGNIYSTSESGKQIIYGTYAPGHVLGELSLDGGMRTASVMTTEKTACSVVRAEDVKRLVIEQPEFAFEMIVRLIGLVRSSNEHIKSLALDDVYGRVVRLLMKKAEPVESGGWIVRERLTQQNIADRVGSSREMVSRIFKDLERGDIIKVEKDAIVIHRKPPPGW